MHRLVRHHAIVTVSALTRRTLGKRCFLVLWTLLLAAVLSITAFCTVCGQFAVYDDMGYLLMTQKTFLSGHPLYDQTFSLYGPAYFAWVQLLHGVLRLPLSHDSALICTSLVWVIASLLCAGYVVRLARNLFLAAATALAVFIILEELKREPGHPQEVCLLLLGGMLVISSLASASRRLGAILGMLGFLAGLLAMIKPNLGVFAALAGWLTLSHLLAGKRLRLLLFGLGAVMAAALPLVLMRRHMEGAGTYCLLESGAILLLLVQLASSRVERPLAWQAIAAPTAGFVLAVLVCVTYALGTGTSLAGLVQGVVLHPLAFDQVFSMWPPFELEDVVLALGLAFAVWVATGPGRTFWKAWPWLAAAAKVGAAGLLISTAVCGDAKAGRTLLWCLPLLVATAYACPRQLTSVWELGPRHFALSLAVLNVLWGYPVWGSQAALSLFLLIPVAMVSLADALRYGRWRSPDSDASPQASAPESPRFGEATAWSAWTCVGVALVLCLASFRCVAAIRTYQQLAPSGLRGSALLRMPPDQVEFYHRIIEAVRTHGRAFYTMPGLESFYFWAAAEPPTQLNLTAWMTMFTPDQQSQVVHDLEKTPDLCVFRWPMVVQFWTHDLDISGNLIVRYIEDNFVAAESFNGCDILVRRSSAGRVVERPQATPRGE
jgi:hypothetical protein